MKADGLASAKAWERTSRIAVLGLLFLSALQFLVSAVIVGTLGATESDKLICAGLVLLAGAALALSLAFRKVGAPTWKHKLAVALLVAPAAVDLFTR